MLPSASLYFVFFLKDILGDMLFQFVIVVFCLQYSLSNASQVVIRNVGFGLSGNFSCEVSADAPSFSTAMAHIQMQVVGKLSICMLCLLSFALSRFWLVLGFDLLNFLTRHFTTILVGLGIMLQSAL